MSKSESIEFIATKLIQVESSGDYIKYILTLEVIQNSKKQIEITIKCSGTLLAVWQLTSECLPKSVYEVAREILQQRWGVLKESTEYDYSEIILTTYNAPQIPPEPRHSLPDIISKSVTVSPDTLHLRTSLYPPTFGEVSFLRIPIADLRDAINSLTKARKGWEFKLLEIHEERAIIDTYLPCNTREEFGYRLNALRCLVAWLNIKEIKRIINDDKDREGSINWLEALLRMNFSSSDVDTVIKQLRLLNKVATGYPTHTDNEDVIKAYNELKINRPIYDFKDAWERILNAYRDSLRQLLDLLKR